MNNIAYEIVRTFIEYGTLYNNEYHAFMMVLFFNTSEQSAILYDSNNKIIFEFDLLSDTLFIDNTDILLSIKEIIISDMKYHKRYGGNYV